MPFGNFGACCTVYSLQTVGPVAYNIAATVIPFFVAAPTNVVAATAASFLVVYGLVVVPAYCAIWCITSRNRTSIRNKLNLKVRGICACEPSRCLPPALHNMCAVPGTAAPHRRPNHATTLSCTAAARDAPCAKSAASSRPHTAEAWTGVTSTACDRRGSAGLARLALLWVVAARRPRSGPA